MGNDSCLRHACGEEQAAPVVRASDSWEIKINRVSDGVRLCVKVVAMVGP